MDSKSCTSVGTTYRIAALDIFNHVEVWLGFLFFPEAYITATHQDIAHRKRWSLETPDLRLDIKRVNDPEAFIVDGKPLSLRFLPNFELFCRSCPRDASWTSDSLALSAGESVRLAASGVLLASMPDALQLSGPEH